MHDHEKQVPIWFFIGIVLTIYGALIAASGIYGAIQPPPEDQRVALWHLHADIWWGILLTIVGIFYTVKFRPNESETLTGKKTGETPLP